MGLQNSITFFDRFALEDRYFGCVATADDVGTSSIGYPKLPAS
jgi:hypothetical protein